MKSEKHCSVIDAEGKHVTYVLVKIRDKPLEDGTTEQVEEIQNYTLKDGEQLVDAQPPVMSSSRRQHRLSSRRSGAARTGRRPPRPTRSPPGRRSTRRRRSCRHRNLTRSWSRKISC